jgi:aryl-alcohol dehydrogenase-like predicted oxidoreductase
MEYRRFGRTDLQVSAIALGSGGPNRFGQRVGIPEAHIHRLVRHALELGINLFDTSPGYSDSELILGRALAGVARDRYHLSTKVVIDDAVTGEHPAPVQQVVASVEASLRRLRVDHVDVLLLAGWPQPGAYRRIVEETIPALRRLQEQGKLRFLSSSEVSAYDGAHAYLTLGLRDELFDSVMVAYNMINQCAEREVFPLCRKRDVGTQVMFAVRRLFPDPVRVGETLAELERKQIVAAGALPAGDPFDWLLDSRTPDLISAAYKFCAAHPAVSTVMTGTNDIRHLERNVAAVTGPPLPAEVMQRLRATFFGVTEVIGN